MRKGQEQALEGNHCRTQDSGLSSFPRETAQKPGHLEIQSWPRTQGAWLCFCPKLCVPGPRRWRVGTLEHAWCGGCPVASAGSGGGLTGDMGESPRVGCSASFLAPGSCPGSRSGGSCPGPPQTPATSSSRSHLVCSSAHLGLQLRLCLLQVADLLVRTATFSPRL